MAFFQIESPHKWLQRGAAIPWVGDIFTMSVCIVPATVTLILIALFAQELGYPWMDFLESCEHLHIALLCLLSIPWCIHLESRGTHIRIFFVRSWVMLIVLAIFLGFSMLFSGTL